MDSSNVEKSSTQAEELETVRTTDLVGSDGIFLDIEGRQLSLKTAKDGHVSTGRLQHAAPAEQKDYPTSSALR